MITTTRPCPNLLGKRFVHKQLTLWDIAPTQEVPVD